MRNKRLEIFKMTGSPQQPTVLVVERDPHVCELITHFLADVELSVTCLADGYRALDRARRERPAIVITDILIPATTILLPFRNQIRGHRFALSIHTCNG